MSNKDEVLSVDEVAKTVGNASVKDLFYRLKSNAGFIAKQDGFGQLKSVFEVLMSKTSDDSAKATYDYLKNELVTPDCSWVIRETMRVRSAKDDGLQFSLWLIGAWDPSRQTRSETDVTRSNILLIKSTETHIFEELLFRLNDLMNAFVSNRNYTSALSDLVDRVSKQLPTDPPMVVSTEMTIKKIKTIVRDANLNDQTIIKMIKTVEDNDFSLAAIESVRDWAAKYLGKINVAINGPPPKKIAKKETPVSTSIPISPPTSTSTSIPAKPKVLFPQPEDAPALSEKVFSELPPLLPRLPLQGVVVSTSNGDFLVVNGIAYPIAN